MNPMPAQRIPLQFDIEFRKSYSRQPDLGKLKNISMTGAFLEAPNVDLYKLDKVTLMVNVSGRSRKINASVVWTNQRGAGIQFHPFNNRDIQIIDDLMYFTENHREKRRVVLDTIFKKVS